MDPSYVAMNGGTETGQGVLRFCCIPQKERLKGRGESGGSLTKKAIFIRI